MKISAVSEMRVRAAYAAAVDRDRDRFKAALINLGDDEDELLDCLRLALAIDTGALVSIYDKRPTNPEIDTLADYFVAAESGWTELPVETVRALLRDLVLMTSPIEISTDTALAALAVGAFLLSGYHGENEAWTDFLDRIEYVLEREEEH